jgi:ribonuclease PH
MSQDKRGGRPWNRHRQIEMICGFHRLAEGSVLFRQEGTVVLVTASIDESVPKFLEGTGNGWITAEYQMHPRANPKRREQRDGRAKPLSGRSKEIERLIGRALRAAVNMQRLGERSVVIDCEVLEADGGTRTASITAGWVALALAANKIYTLGLVSGPVLSDQVAAISVGHVDGSLALDLCYLEDSAARVDMNVVGTQQGNIVEVQSTAEGAAVPRAEIDSMIDLGLEGVASLCALQRAALDAAGVRLDRVLSQSAA